MTTTLKRLVLPAAAFVFSLSLGLANDYGVPGTCPQYPIQQVGSEYIYYSYYHPTDCNSYQTAYLQGNYPWFVNCNTQSQLCESSGLSTTLKSFEGLSQPVSNKHDAKAAIPEYARRCVEKVTNHPIRHLDLDGDGTGDNRYAVLHEVEVKVSETDKRELFYGFETHDPRASPSTLSVEYIDEIGNPAGSETFVVRERKPSDLKKAYVIFLKE